MSGKVYVVENWIQYFEVQYLPLNEYRHVSVLCRLIHHRPHEWEWTDGVLRSPRRMIAHTLSTLTITPSHSVTCQSQFHCTGHSSAD